MEAQIGGRHTQQLEVAWSSRWTEAVSKQNKIIFCVSFVPNIRFETLNFLGGQKQKLKSNGLNEFVGREVV